MKKEHLSNSQKLIKNIQDNMEVKIENEIFGVKISTTQKLWDDYKEWIRLKNERMDVIFEKGDNPIGAIGGNLSLKITQTSLGRCYVVSDSYEKDEFDLTNYSNW